MFKSRIVLIPETDHLKYTYVVDYYYCYIKSMLFTVFISLGSFLVYRHVNKVLPGMMIESVSFTRNFD